MGTLLSWNSKRGLDTALPREPTKSTGVTHLFQLLEVLPKEPQRPVRLGNTEVHDAFFEYLLDAMLLHIHLTSFQRVLVLRVEAGWGGHGQNVFYGPVKEN